MKTYLSTLLLTGALASPSFAAVCSCDAPPSCGSSRPPSCFQQESHLLAGKIFIEESGPGASKQLAFSNFISAGVIQASYGSPADGIPFGTYYVKMTSENQFNLMLAPFNGRPHELVEIFEFHVLPSSQVIDSLEASNGKKYFLYKETL